MQFNLKCFVNINYIDCKYLNIMFKMSSLYLHIKKMSTNVINI